MDNIFILITDNIMYVSEELKKVVRLRTTQFQSMENEKKWFRKDQCWARINRFQYWDRESQYWWEIDHIIPVANLGSDNVSNLRILHRKNNLEKSNGRLSCAVVSRWTQNYLV